jgi:hypothetical protein
MLQGNTEDMSFFIFEAKDKCFYMTSAQKLWIQHGFTIVHQTVLNEGGRKPTHLTSMNICINAFSVVPWGGWKQMSIGKIRMLDGLVSTHCTFWQPIK